MKWREQRTLTASTLVTANRIQQTSVHSRKNSRWRAGGGEGGKMPEIDRYIRALWAQSIYSYKSSFCAHSLSLSLFEVTEVAIKHRLRSEHWHTVSHSDTSVQSCLGDRLVKKMKRSAVTDGTCQLLLTTKTKRTWTRTRTEENTKTGTKGLFWWSHFPLFLMHYWAVTNQTTSQKNRQ